MLSIPLFIFLAIYCIYLLFFLLFSAANVYHIYSTATFTAPAVLITVGVSLWCMMILAATFIAITGVDWQTTLVLLGNQGLITIQ